MKKNFVNESAGTLRTDTVSFSVILVFVVYIFAALTFFQRWHWAPLQSIWLCGAKSGLKIKKLPSQQELTFTASQILGIQQVFLRFWPCNCSILAGNAAFLLFSNNP